MSDIGDNIKKLRIGSGMSQGDLGKKIGKTRSAVSQYEKGEIVPRMGVIEKMSVIFRVPKSQIIGDSYHYAYVKISNEKIEVTDDELELVELYRRIPPLGRHAVIAGLKDYVERQ